MARNRERRTGRYGYQGHLERLCSCGHTLGQHAGASPHDCFESGCSCERFRPVKKKPVFVEPVHTTHKGYSIRSSLDQRMIYITKDGHSIGSASTLAEAKHLIDELTNPRYRHAINPAGHLMRIHTLLFDKHTFTERQARAWAHAHGYRTGDVEITPAGRYIHLIQTRSRGRVVRTIPIGSTLSGIRAIVTRNPLCCG